MSIRYKGNLVKEPKLQELEEFRNILPEVRWATQKEIIAINAGTEVIVVFEIFKADVLILEVNEGEYIGLMLGNEWHEYPGGVKAGDLIRVLASNIFFVTTSFT